MVAAEEAYSEVLQLEFEPREGEDEQPPVLQAATPNPVLEAAIMKTKDKHIEGNAPPHFQIRLHTVLMPLTPCAWTTKSNTPG